MRKIRKYTPEEKIQIAKEYLSGKSSYRELAHRLGCLTPSGGYPGSLRQWVAQYRAHGEEVFYQTKNNTYTKEFKQMVVKEYLSGTASLEALAEKYKISAAAVLHTWVLSYNANRELKDYCPQQEVYMAEARRKTTIDERKEIVEYCINHNRNYKKTASIYAVSYSQVYSWVKKYDSYGEDGLTDRRGRHKTDDEVDELERLRRENLRLKRQLQEKDMIAELLKKVKEFERM